MAGWIKALRLLGDESRLRILRLLRAEELSVAELQEILEMGQSRISMQLAQLKQAGLVQVRRAGQKSLYRSEAPRGAEELLAKLVEQTEKDLTQASQDDGALRLVLQKRKDHLRRYFDELAGRFGRNYVPGRSWKGLAEMLLKLMPPMVIADLGAGEGTLSMLFAQRAKHVIAVDSSEKMVEFGTDVAKRNGVSNVEYRFGDMEELPIADGEVDIALFHQTLHHAMHPEAAMKEAWRVLRPGGRVVVMDLLKHRFEEAREMYADVWLGFSEAELVKLVSASGFTSVEAAVVHRDDEAPHFETVLVFGTKDLA